MLSVLFAFYLLALSGLTIWSYTQADPGLYLLKSDLFIHLQRQFVLWNESNRILSGLVITIILFLLITVYVLIVQKYKDIRIERIKMIITGIVCISFFSYPVSFSHDIINYLLYGKIAAFYHRNPYLIQPIKFSHEHLLQFSHWKYDTPPYGPVWILFMTVCAALSFGNDTAGLFLIKLFAVICYLLTIYVISEIAGIVKTDKRKAILFYALNPLVIIESLVNPHPDVLMILLLMTAVLLLLSKRVVKSLIFYVFSFATKLTTLPMLAVYLIRYRFKKMTDVRLLKIVAIAAYLCALGITIVQRTVYPWYLVLPITCTAVFADIPFYRYAAYSFTAAALVRYLPYFYLGFFNPGFKIRIQLFLLFLVPYLIWLFLNLIQYCRKHGFSVSSAYHWVLKEMEIL